MISDFMADEVRRIRVSRAHIARRNFWRALRQFRLVSAWRILVYLIELKRMAKTIEQRRTN